MSWLSNKFEQWAVNGLKEELSTFVNALKSMDGQEIGFIVALATNGRHVFEEKEHNLMDPIVCASKDPEAIFLLIRLKRDMQKRGRFHVVPALMVWIHTIRAAMHIELRGLAREMWGQLERGFPYVEESAFTAFNLDGRLLKIDGADQFPIGFSPTPQ